MMMPVVLVLLLSVSIVFADMVRYDDHTVFRLSLNASNSQEVDMYRHLRDNDFLYNCSFWSNSDIQVSPESSNKIQNMLKDAGISFNVMIENVQTLIDSERERMVTATQVMFGADPDPTFFNDYRDYDSHNEFMRDIVSTYPQLATSVTVGTSYEGRSIGGVVVTGSSTRAKPGIYYECGIHSREWIAPTTCAYIMYQLVTQYGQDARITNLVDNIEWHFVPVVNVDGYVFTFSSDRMWRKTRKPNGGSSCIGTDPNRNWDSHWCEAGSSNNPCSDSYCGSGPFTEQCVTACADYVKAHTNIVAFVDFHAYGQMWMRPYGYTNANPRDYQSQNAMASAACDALRAVNGMTYRQGSIWDVVYPASGSSADYIYDTLGREWPYGVELRDTGRYGFILPASEILPNGEEVFAAALAMGEYVLAAQ